MALDDQKYTSAGVFPGDIIIKSAIDLALNDMRKNIWLLEDVFAPFIEMPLLRAKYGMGEIDRAKEFLKNNEIPIYLVQRFDSHEFPCITVSIGNSTEDTSLATLADSYHIDEELTPEDIDKPLPSITGRFVATKNQDSDGNDIDGEWVVPSGTTGVNDIREQQYVIDTNDGERYQINEVKYKTQDDGSVLTIIVLDLVDEDGNDIDLTQMRPAIVPRYAFYSARRERVISQETYNIGVHVEGDPSFLLLLYSIVKYGLWRYKEALLEGNNFQLSKLHSTDIVRNQAFQAENVYSRFITLSGQIEESWLKTPFRNIESADGLVEAVSSPAIPSSSGSSGCSEIDRNEPVEYDDVTYDPETGVTTVPWSPSDDND